MRLLIIAGLSWRVQQYFCGLIYLLFLPIAIFKPILALIFCRLLRFEVFNRLEDTYGILASIYSLKEVF